MGVFGVQTALQPLVGRIWLENEQGKGFPGHSIYANKTKQTSQTESGVLGEQVVMTGFKVSGIFRDK